MLSQVANTLDTTGSVLEELVSIGYILKLLRNRGGLFSPLFLGNPLCSNIPIGSDCWGSTRISGSSSEASEQGAHKWSWEEKSGVQLSMHSKFLLVRV